MHYVWHRSENKHSTSLTPVLLSFTPGDIVYLVYMSARLPGLSETVVCCFPWQKSRTVKHRMCARSGLISPLRCISPHQTANQQSALQCKHIKRERGGEEEEGNALQRMYSEVRLRLKRGHDSSLLCHAALWNRLLFPGCLQIPSSLLSMFKLNLHTHTNTNRGNIVTALSASLWSQ